MKKIKETKTLESIRNIIELRGTPELLEAWDRLEPFLLERRKELLEHFFDLSNWTNPSESLVAILKIIKAIPGKLSIEEICKISIDLIHDHIGFEIILINILDPGRKLFFRTAQKGIPTKKFEEMVNRPVPPEHYNELMQDKFKIGNSYIIRWWHEDAELPEDNSYTPRSDEETEWNSKDILLVPMYDRNDELVGMISVDKPPDGKVPDKNSLAALEIIAARTSQAIEESRIYEQTERRLTQMELLYDTSTRAAAIENENKFLKNICEKLRMRFNYLWVGILLLDTSSEALYVASQCGLENTRFSDMRFPIGKNGGVIGKVAASGQYKIIDNLKEKNWKYLPFHHKANSEIAVPIRQKDKVLGVLVVESESVKAFTQEYRRFSRTIANQIASALENLDVKKSKEEELRVRRALFEVGTVLNTILEPQRLLRKIMDILRINFNFSSAALFLVDETEEYLVLKAFAGMLDQDMDKYKLKVGREGIVGFTAGTGKPLYVADVNKFAMYIPGFTDSRSELAVPIIYRDKVLGVLDVESDIIDAFDEGDVQLLELFATQIAIAINNASLYEELEELAVTDEKTGLFNYRSFEENIARELHRSKRLKHSLSLLFADLDLFKVYNDTFGHQQGDKVLKLFSDVVLSIIREKVDFAARYGGEEFTIILPEVSKEGAFDVAERIRKEFEKQSKQKLLMPVTVSFGVATFPGEGKNPAELLKSADECLYRAKSSGRNRTCKIDSEGKKRKKK